MILHFALFFSLFLGAISAAYDDRFVRIILGDEYVNMTLENIKMVIRWLFIINKESWMFIGITINNIGVAMKSYVLVCRLEFWPFLCRCKMALYLGSFNTFSTKTGVRTKFVAFGFMEQWRFSVLLLQTMAGFILAGSILFRVLIPVFNPSLPGHAESLKILISTLPFFVMAGFVEALWRDGLALCPCG